MTKLTQQQEQDLLFMAQGPINWLASLERRCSYTLDTDEMEVVFTKGKSDSVRMVLNVVHNTWHLWVFPLSASADIEIFPFPSMETAYTALDVWATYYEAVVLENFKMF